nr:hypothetical protein [uncultured Corynebacterium sp.]
MTLWMTFFGECIMNRLSFVFDGLSGWPYWDKEILKFFCLENVLFSAWWSERVDGAIRDCSTDGHWVDTSQIRSFGGG